MVRGRAALGLGVMLGCMIESALGIAAARSSRRSATSSTSTGTCLLADDPWPGVGLEDGVQVPSDAARPGCPTKRVAVLARASRPTRTRQDRARPDPLRRARGRRGRRLGARGRRATSRSRRRHRRRGARRRPRTRSSASRPRAASCPPEWSALARGARSGPRRRGGLHTSLGRDPELVAVAAGRGSSCATSAAARGPDAERRGLGHGAAVVHTVGSDCAIGKMTVTLELDRGGAARAGCAVFVPTGQTGIAIAGWGIAVDHVIADYVAGAAERLVLEGAERGDLLFVEGQGAILHPLYSGVTLGLLHGSAPHALVLCHVRRGRPRSRAARRSDPAARRARRPPRARSPCRAPGAGRRDRAEHARLDEDGRRGRAIAAVEDETGLAVRRPCALRR